MKPSKTIKIAVLLFALVVSVLNGFAQLEHKKAATGQNQVLPVSLISFNLKSEKPNEIIVTWSTANEKNNAYFIVEASRDGKNFVQIAHVRGAGDSNEVLNYQLTIFKAGSIALQGYFPFLIFLLIPSIRNRKLRLAVFSIFALFALSCVKEKEPDVQEDFYVRLRQVDNNGQITTYEAKTIKLIVFK